MVKHTHTIRRQFADKLFECLTILCVFDQFAKLALKGVCFQLGSCAQWVGTHGVRPLRFGTETAIQSSLENRFS